MSKVIGYSVDEMIEFGFFEWTIVEDRPATPEELENSYGCEYWEDCPCCKCEDKTGLRYVFGVRPRWSKSGKRMVEQTNSWLLCSAHQ